MWKILIVYEDDKEQNEYEYYTFEACLKAYVVMIKLVSRDISYMQIQHSMHNA